MMKQRSTMLMPALMSAIAVSLLLFLSSCGGDATTYGEAGEPVKGDWIIIHELSDPEGINPITTNDASASGINRLVFDGLLMQDWATSELIPNLAVARPTVSEDHLTYTFVMKDGIRFSDGKPCTSKDVVFSFKAAMNPLVVDAAALRNYYEDVADVQAPDERTVVITMIKPYFMAEYQLGDLRVLPKHLMDPKGLTDKYTFADCRDMSRAQSNAAMQEFATWFGTPEVRREPQFNIGTGPWIYEEWKTGEYVRLKRNDSYWNAANANQWQKAMADKLVFTVVTDRSTAVVKMKNQEMDFMEFVPAVKFVEEVDTVSTPHLVKKAYPQSVYTYIGWNMRRPQFSDKRVRRALGMLVDREALIKQVNYGLASIQNSPLYNTRPEYDKSIAGLKYDPAGAKQLLAEAGWTDSNGDGVLDKTINGVRTDFTLTFLLNNGNETRERIALICVDEFKKVGIKAGVQKIDWSVFLETTRRHEFDAYIGSWINDDIPSDPYQIWHSSQASNKGSNMVGFINKRADELMELNRIEFDEAKRAAYMKEFQAIVTDEQPYTFLWAPLNPGVYNRRLQNVQFHTPRPGYLPTEWWVPKGQWKYASAP